jgi:hypothetical protein
MAAFILLTIVILFIFPVLSRAQAALLLEEPYGFFGSVNPTGHNAIYFQRICAETPVKLRRCRSGEMGSVLSRYQGIDQYDWIAMPLLPYLYSVEKASDVPAQASRETVSHLRNSYHQAQLLNLGTDVPPGNFWHGGWAQLVGLSYERRIFAFRFETTEEQDDAFIAWMNDRPNLSHFRLLFNNCADFARLVMNFYFPGSFQRSVFPDAGMTAPNQIVYKLERYARKHPEAQLTVFELPQIPGCRRHSRKNKSIAESLSTTGYALPIALINPYLAGGLFADYLVRGRHHLIPKHPLLLSPEHLEALTAPAHAPQNPLSAGIQVTSAAGGSSDGIDESYAAKSGLREIKVADE